MASVIELCLSRANPIGEQTINRDLLLELAPDREDLLVNNSIESIRDGLKIVPQNEGDDDKWLSVRLEQRKVRFRFAFRPLSGLPFKRRELLTSKFKVSDTTSTDTGVFSGSWVSFDKPSDLRLSSEQVCVSPRPLGPTHTLVLYSERPSPTGIYPRTIEMPIEALLFALHCPNLKVPRGARIPYRRQSVMPRVLLRVRHLASFPTLVVYMHTRDHERLFRSILPPFITDALDLLFLEKKTTTFHRVAQDLATQGTYDVLVQAGSIISGLRINIEDVGLKETMLDAKVELIFRVLIKSITYKSRAEFD